MLDNNIIQNKDKLVRSSRRRSAEEKRKTIERGAKEEGEPKMCIESVRIRRKRTLLRRITKRNRSENRIVISIRRRENMSDNNSIEEKEKLVRIRRKSTKSVRKNYKK